MSVFRFKFLIFILVFLVIFIIILLQELIVLDKFEYNFLIPNKLILKNDCKQNNDYQIDLVYTWVNGSDLNLKKQIKLYQQLNNSNDECTESIETPFLLIIPEIITSTYQKLISNLPKNDNKSWISIKYKIDKDISSSLFYFEDINKARDYLINKPKELINYKIHQLYFSKLNCNLTDEFKSIKLFNTIKINNKLNENKFINNLSNILKIDNSKFLKYKFKFNDHNIIGLNSKFNVNQIEILINKQYSNEIEFNDQLFYFKLLHDNLILNSNDDAFGENRFNDKDELKYSLRSVEKFANWINNIYIVTNGQIPNWLNISHPKIKIITHNDIYPNKSHLPTFNSASIECHLHRIKGLSKKFIYLNDDFLFGKNVYLEDFYSRSKGYQIRLGWSAPNCAVNCPTPWLNDGICDKACNTSLCLFDGGDCLNSFSNSTESSNKLPNYSALPSENYKRNLDFSFLHNLNYDFKSHSNDNCEIDCPLNWLADDHCDESCNNKECGYDLGDCKLDKLVDVFLGSNFFSNQTFYQFKLNKQHKGIYLNLTNYYDQLGIKKEINDLDLNLNRMEFIKKLAFNQVHNLIFILIDFDVMAEEEELNLNFKSLNSNKIKSTNLTIQLTKENQMSDKLNNTIINLNQTSTNEFNQTSILLKRKLMDFYGDSLSYSNYIINKKFSIQNRKVPAHMPILLDKDILNRMNIELNDEIELTSSHKFRNSHDLQFAFTYQYFLMSEQYYPTLEEILKEFDLDLDNYLDRSEAKTFYLRAIKVAYDEKNFNKFWNESINCLNNKSKDKISIKILVNCNDFNFLNDDLKIRKRNQYQILKMDDVSFNQISNDLNKMQSQLDNLRKEPKQFICINDNFSYRDSDKIIKANEILHDFYDSILPLASEFENNLVIKTKNDNININRRIKNQNLNLRNLLFIFIIICICIILFSRICYNHSRTKFTTIQV